jgi:serine phosphatase RsbU (regulator of sigma subunit)
MSVTSKRSWIASALYLLAGLVAVLLVAILAWFDLTAPLNLRQPVVSPGGDYFAYFDRAEHERAENAPSELIISTVQGRVVAQYPLQPGIITWSSADHLMVVHERQNGATVIPNTAGTFVVLTTLALSPGSAPKWARSGTKIGFVRPGSSGPEIAVYDLLQTQASVVPLPAGLHLNQPAILFWSPGGQELYFQNNEGKESVLYRCNVVSGDAQPIARSPLAWGELVPGLPEMSPDGTRIYLPEPLGSVIDADTGAILWSLPADGKTLWSPWSSDGAKLYYARAQTLRKVYARDFSSNTDQLVLGDAPSNGFFSQDGRSYFYRIRPPLAPGTFASRLKAWLQRDWGWRHVDTLTGIALPMGREELWPRETTRQGAIVMSRDDLSRVRYGLYDPSARFLSEFQIPTDREDVRRMFDSRVIIFLAAGLYGLLGIFVFLARPRNASAQGLYALSLVLMLLFVSLDAARSLHAAYALPGPGVTDPEIAALGWVPLLPRALWMEDQYFLFFIILALLPPALFRFSVAFPEGNTFLGPRRFLQIPFYAIAFLPLAALLVSLTSYRPPSAIRPLALSLTIIGGGAAMGSAFLALTYSLRRPPNRRARDQVRWVLIALSIPVLALVVLAGVNALRGHWHGTPWQSAFTVPSTTTLSLICLFAPLAIGYALLAHKLFDIHLLFLRTLRYSFLTGVVIVIYLLLAAGLSWAITGSIGNPSTLVFIVATVLTAIILAPARTRLERAVRRSISREHFDVSQTLQNLAQGLPNILDRQILASVMSQTVRGALKAQTFYLFTLDRRTRKFNLVAPEREPSPGIAGLEFDPGEPLCKYLLGQSRPFEVEVSPYDPRLIPVFQSAADRLVKMRAAVIFGLERRGELTGLMVLGGKTSDEFYNSEELQLLAGVARQAAVALENAELLEEASRGGEPGKDLELAEGPQFFPGEIPVTEGCQIAGRSIAAKTPGGDYYDFLELPGSKIGLAFGGVSGKGVAASALMTSIQGQLRAEAGGAKNLPALVRRINRQLFTSFPGAKYCTLFYCVYDPATRRLEFVNAGHNPPLVLGPKGIRFLASTGVPLGLFVEASPDVRLANLEYGATVILFSDGVINAHDEQGEPFGLDRLMASVTRGMAMDASVMVDRILNDVREFTGGRPSEDHRTIVILKATAV